MDNFINRRNFLASTALYTAFLTATGCHNSAQFTHTIQLHGVDLSGMDPHIRPQDDLFRHVNGKWIAETSIPPEKSSIPDWQALNTEKLKKIIENITATQGDEYKVKTLYESALNTKALDLKGLANLQPSWNLVDKSQTKEELAYALGRLSRDYFFSCPFDFIILANLKNTAKNIFTVVPIADDDHASAIGLSYNHLFDTDQQKIYQDYQTYLTTLFTAAHLPNPAILAQKSVDFEKSLLSVLGNIVQRDAMNKNYHIFSLSALEQAMPNFPLKNFIRGKAISEDKFTEIAVFSSKYCTHFDTLWEQTNLEFLKLYIKGSIVRQNTDYLPKQFRDASFDFYQKTLNGIHTPEPRWLSALNVFDTYLKDALGKLYVKQYFSSEAKNQVQLLIDDLKTAFHISLENSWLSPVTKKAALAKLEALKINVGYPNEWKNYDEVDITDDYYQDIVNLHRWSFNQALAKFNQPVDKNCWNIPATAVGAVNMFIYNTIFFPAGILQPPFFDPTAEPEVNYGAIGAIIGHEISHAFDDQGSQYDYQGNLVNWWRPDDKAHFNKLTHKLIAQYNSVVPEELSPQYHINGTTTLGENAADLNGLTIALRALRAHYNKGNIAGEIPREKLQTAFLSWSRVWRTKTRKTSLIEQIETDEHSPNEIRVNQVVKNIDDFSTAFDVKPGDKEYLLPEQRVHIW